jgi:hypothetical protein
MSFSWLEKNYLRKIIIGKNSMMSNLGGDIKIYSKIKIFILAKLRHAVSTLLNLPDRTIAFIIAVSFYHDFFELSSWKNL